MIIVLTASERPPALGVRAGGQGRIRAVRLPGEDKGAQVEVVHRAVGPADQAEGLAAVVAIEADPGAVGLGAEPGGTARCRPRSAPGRWRSRRCRGQTWRWPR